MGNEIDRLNRETSISAELTEKGITGRTNSRAVSAFDRLLGNVSEFLNVRMEGQAAIKEAKLEVERQFIETTGRMAIERLQTDPAFAERAIRGYLGGIERKQSNKDGVAFEALEHLRHSPPETTQSESGPEELSEEFLTNAEPYAERASTDDLRARWGRVYAEEIKKPGTFFSKALRVIDELDAPTARLFERLCALRLHNVIPACSIDLTFDEKVALISAELLVDPGNFGQVRRFAKATRAGANIWVCMFDRVGLSFPVGAPVPPFKPQIAIYEDDGTPAIPSYVLTPTGDAVASILPNKQDDALFQFVQILKGLMPSVPFSKAERDGSAVRITSVF